MPIGKVRKEELKELKRQFGGQVTKGDLRRFRARRAAARLRKAQAKRRKVADKVLKGVASATIGTPVIGAAVLKAREEIKRRRKK